MARFFHTLIMVLARATKSDLAHYVEYLKAENQILRSKFPKRVICTPAERQRLLKLGEPLGSAIKDLITIVTPPRRTRMLLRNDSSKHFSRNVWTSSLSSARSSWIISCPRWWPITTKNGHIRRKIMIC